MRDYVGPLTGLHLRVFSTAVSWNKIMPFIVADAVYANGKGDMENYWHTGPGAGISRSFSLKKWDISPFVYGGFIWGQMSNASKTQSLSLPYSSGGIMLSWYVFGPGLLRSLDISMGYTHVFSDLPSGYLHTRLGVTFEF